MREPIYSKAPSSLPVMSACVIGDPLRLENSGCQVAYGVAAENCGLFASCGTNCLIRVPYNLSGGSRPVVEVPTRTCYLPAHCRTPSSKQFIGCEIVFDEFISPLNGGTYGLHRLIESLGMRWIKS